MQPLLQNAVERPRCQIIRRMPRDRDASGLRRMLKLTVAALRCNFPPAIGFDQLDRLANLWHSHILLCEALTRLLQSEIFRHVGRYKVELRLSARVARTESGGD